MTFSNLLTPYAIEVFLPIAKWLAISVVAAVIVLGAVIFFVKKDFFSKYIKGAFLATFIFLALLGITCLVMEIAKKYGKPIDGHAPALSGDGLAKYVSAGISTDHECSTL
ncbi:MAG: hypothetical protein IKB30_03625, partial [Clostridia bacterium]|nr:hypothetical protein [Clostridia bacterium]